MASNPKQTSKRVAKVASKQLTIPTATKAAKTTAASALAQAQPKKKLK
jgi:hypothetical protein